MLQQKLQLTKPAARLASPNEGRQLRSSSAGQRPASKSSKSKNVREI